MVSQTGFSIIVSPLPPLKILPESPTCPVKQGVVNA
jgi:hypothetical protein